MACGCVWMRGTPTLGREGERPISRVGHTFLQTRTLVSNLVSLDRQDVLDPDSQNNSLGRERKNFEVDDLESSSKESSVLKNPSTLSGFHPILRIR